MKKILQLFLRTVYPLLLFPALPSAFPSDSVFEPLFRSFDLFPDYYLRFDLSTFALHRDAFFKRQYLAESRPDLEFKLISYRDLLSSIWDVDFLFGLGEVPGNNVFTVLNVAFGIDPRFELKLPRLFVDVGLTHRCFHEIDRKDFPLVWLNRIHGGASSVNFRLNDYFRTLVEDTLFRFENRFSWKAEAGYYLKEFFGLADPGKLNGNNPSVIDLSSAGRYAFYRRRSWIFSLRGETTVGWFAAGEGYRVKNRCGLSWKQSFGIEAYFSRGNRGSCFYLLYHLDDVPVPPDAPEFTLGNSRFSKNRLAQLGVTFFN
ncbi:MAG: hypothetical protein JXA18_12770 [Chitinispirillaceae bacterium]|nr:hypothetical protein [Chitinispirillaceae bacterium]